MTDTPPPTPYLSYASNPDGNARLLVLLAVVFNYVMAGIDILFGLFYAGITIFMFYVFRRMAAIAAAASTSMPATMPGGITMTTFSGTTIYTSAPPPPQFLVFMYIGFAALAIAAGIVKLIGTNKLRKRTPSAWGWGLAVGIIGCVQLWCSVMCIIPLAVGVYTITILCLERVRAHLANYSAPSPFPTPIPSPPSPPPP